jgi:rhodanese-related sulfurtransferase
MSNALAVLTLAMVAAQAPAAKTAEMSLRRAAVTSVTPEYPASSVKAGVSGIAVADLIAAATGIVQSIEVLEAPDQAIADAVRAALNQWKFPAAPFPMQAKMTFYFRIEQGKGRVLNPQDMPGGPVFQPRPAAPTYTPENPPPLVKPPAPQPAKTVELRDENTTAITFEELQKVTGASRPTILDVGDRASFKRGHLDGAINIPYDELLVRAGIELRGRHRIVIDCTQEQNFHCLVADHVLKDAGIKDVRILRR